MGGPHAAAQGRRRGVHPGPRGVPQHTKGVQKEGGDGSLFQERRGRAGMNCIKIVLPGKTDSQSENRSSGRPIILKIVSENRFSGKTYFYTIASRRKGSSSAKFAGRRWRGPPSTSTSGTSTSRFGNANRAARVSRVR